MSPANPRTSLSSAPGADWRRIAILGAFLAALVWLAFVFDTDGPDDLGRGQPVVEAEIETPKIDEELLAAVRDDSRQTRLLLEKEPLAHLLEKSLRVVPTIAKALGLRDEPVPVDVIRSKPSAWRGSYLGYHGILKFVSRDGKPGHPVDGFRIHEGWIETEAGETVLFQVSLPPEQVEVGDFVRVEGFFLKLRDSHHMPTADRAPLLIGPEIFPDYATWEPITALDPTILDRVRDGVVENGRFVDTEGMEKSLAESQAEPLWHLASYALSQADRPLEAWRKEPALQQKEQLDQMRFGQLGRGTPMRVLGTFVFAHTFAARPNPLQVEFWTQAWVQIRLNGKVIPIWIPGQVDDDWRFREDIEVRGYYFRRLMYESDGGDKWFTPVFVAAALDRFTPPEDHPLTSGVKWAFVLLVASVIGLFFMISRRDRRAREQHEQTLSERRRRRQGRAQQTATPSGA